jgi:hypothetical protein
MPEAAGTEVHAAAAATPVFNVIKMSK